MAEIQAPLLSVYDNDGNRIPIPTIKGEDGHTPVKGVDYNTEADKQEIIDAVKNGITIPDVPSWAMQPNKPTYTSNEVGAVSSEDFQKHKTEADEKYLSDFSVRGAAVVCSPALGTKLEVLSSFNQDKYVSKMTLLHTGKNMIEIPMIAGGVKNEDGSVTVTASENVILEKTIRNLPERTYNFGNLSEVPVTILRDGEEPMVLGIHKARTFKISNGELTVRWDEQAAGTVKTYKAQLEMDDHHTAYEPYVGHFYEVDLGTSANYVNYDWISGRLRVLNPPIPEKRVPPNDIQPLPGINHFITEVEVIVNGTGKIQDHSNLAGRRNPDQHPISAISGLDDALKAVVAVDADPTTSRTKLKIETTPVNRIMVPTELSELNPDAEHMTVTQAEKDKWNIGDGVKKKLIAQHIVKNKIIQPISLDINTGIYTTNAEDLSQVSDGARVVISYNEPLKNNLFLKSTPEELWNKTWMTLNKLSGTSFKLNNISKYTEGNYLNVDAYKFEVRGNDYSTTFINLPRLKNFSFVVSGAGFFGTALSFYNDGSTKFITGAVNGDNRGGSFQFYNQTGYMGYWKLKSALGFIVKVPGAMHMEYQFYELDAHRSMFVGIDSNLCIDKNKFGQVYRSSNATYDSGIIYSDDGYPNIQRKDGSIAYLNNGFLSSGSVIEVYDFGD